VSLGVVWDVLGWCAWRREKLTDVAAREGKKIKEFGYVDTPKQSR
jgi:hypothetical protein